MSHYILWLLVLGVWVWRGAVPCRADDPPTLVGTAQLPQVRAAQQAWEQLQQARQAQDWPRLSSLLKEVLDGPATWIAGPIAWRDVQAELRLWLKSLPAEGLQHYQQHFEPLAQAEYEAAVAENDRAGCVAVYLKYPMTATGQAAGLQALGMAAEAGHSSQVQLLGEALLDELSETDSRVGSIRARLLWAYHQQRDRTHFDNLLREHGSQVVTLAGRMETLAAWSQREFSRHDNLENTAVGQPPVFPAAHPQWRREWLEPGELLHLFEQARQDYREAGLVGWPVSQAVVSGQHVYWRTLTGVEACDLSTGERLWENTRLSPHSHLTTRTAALQNPSFRNMLGEQLLRRLLADEVQGALVVARSRVYAVAERTGSMAGQGQVFTGDEPVKSAGHRLWAFEAKTGAERWSWPEQGSPEVLLIRGAPAVVDEELYLLARVGTRLELQVLDAATGQSRWNLPLCELPQSEEQPQFFEGTALPVKVAGRWILCPTGAGCVVAVDRLTQRGVWARRYPDEKQGTVRNQPRSPLQEVSPLALHGGWLRSDAVVQHGERILLATPEAEYLRAFQLKSGDMLWEIPREDGLCLLADEEDSRVVVVGLHTARGIDGHTGKEMWRLPIPSPIGRGVFQQGRILLPLTSGEVWQVDVATGHVTRGKPGRGEALGNLTSADGWLLSQRGFSGEAYPAWEVAQTQWEARLKASPENPGIARQLADQVRRGGLSGAALQQFREAHQRQPDDKQARFRLLEALVESQWPFPQALSSLSQPPSGLPSLSGEQREELQQLIDMSGEDEQGLWYSFRAACLLGEPKLIVLLASRLSSRLTLDGLTGPRDARVRTRADRALQGELLDVASSLPDKLREELWRELQHLGDAAVMGRDPFAVQRYVAQFGELSPGKELRWKHSAAVGIGWHPARQELQLLDLVASRDPETALRAGLRMAEWQLSRSLRSEAARGVNRLRERWGDRPVDGSRPLSAWLMEMPLSILADHLEPRDPWPVVTPKINTSKARSTTPYLVPIPIEAEVGSPWDRLQLHYQSSGKRLTFQGDQGSGIWEVSLPPSRSPLHEHFPTFQAWGLGQLGLVRMGTQLYGITPWDNTGEPNARVVWTRDLAPDLPGQYFHLQWRVAAFGQGQPEVITLDRFNRTVADVGPVTPGYVCYRQRGQLIALDPSSGRELWRRMDEPAGTLLAGDHHLLLIGHPVSQRWEAVRAIDGQTQWTEASPFAFDKLVGLAAGYAVIWESQSDQPATSRQRLQVIDLLRMKTVWEQTYPANSKFFQPDEETCAVWQPDGLLEFRYRETGRLLTSINTPRPQVWERVYVWRDLFRWYVFVSGPVANPQRQLPQVHGGWHQPMLHGTLLGISRKAAETFWKREFSDVPFRLRQPASLPCFVLSYRAPSESGGQPDGVLHLFDKRNGQDLLLTRDPQQVPEISIEAQAEEGWVEIVHPTERTRLEFR